MNVNDLLKIAIERKASDLHLKVGSHPIIRIDGRLTLLGTEGYIEIRKYVDLTRGEQDVEHLVVEAEALRDRPACRRKPEVHEA